MISGAERRRRWSEEDRARIIAVLSEPGAAIAQVARREDVCTDLVFKWRREMREAVEAYASGFARVVIEPAPAAAPSSISSSNSYSQPIAIWITPCNWRSVKVAGACTLRQIIGLSSNSQILNCMTAPPGISDAEAGDEPVRFGNTSGAQEVIEDFEGDLFSLESDYPNLRKFVTAARAFAVYIASNTASLINYGERYRSGERISSAFAEATVNAEVSKRFAKKQQMQWTRRGAHLLLKTRTRTRDGTLRPTFERGFPGLAGNNTDSAIQAEAARPPHTLACSLTRTRSWIASSTTPIASN
ncbi:hypothetical protein GGD83_004750 [Rhodoblastus sphagnicola]|nr:hypothetical protein [Rhodoblastus sphagnicola]